jgi:hypothetical protein
MKHTNNFQVLPVTKWVVMLAVALTAVAMTGCDDDDNNSVNNRSYTIRGDGDRMQVVPAITDTTYHGASVISGTYNPNTKVFNYTTNWIGLSGPPTSGGFYNGASGTAGVAVGAPWTFDANATENGSMSGTMTLTQEQADQLTSGKWYYTYGTAANTGGEVRGQISAER